MVLRRHAASTSRISAIPSGVFIGLVVALAPAAASAQFMALTPPAKTDAPHAEAPKPVPPQGRTVEHALAGALPNQRTGPSRQRVVRDICIGCDR